MSPPAWMHEVPRPVWVVIQWDDHGSIRVCGVYSEQENAEAERRLEPIRRRVIESALLDAFVTAS